MSYLTCYYLFRSTELRTRRAAWKWDNLSSRSTARRWRRCSIRWVEKDFRRWVSANEPFTGCCQAHSGMLREPWSKRDYVPGCGGEKIKSWTEANGSRFSRAITVFNAAPFIRLESAVKINAMRQSVTFLLRASVRAKVFRVYPEMV